MTDTLNPFSLANKKILVTGAASGIGCATAIILSNLGADLILVDRDADGLASTRSRCKPSDTCIAFDLRKTEEIKELVHNIVSSANYINGFVHLAGIPYISPLKSINENKYLDVLRVNTLAGLELAKAFAHKKVNGDLPGSVVFISSVYALVGSVANVGYAMSKAALHGITKSLAVELAPKKIRVNCIAPGFVKTNMLQNTSQMFLNDRDEVLENLHPLGLGDASDVAYACAYLLSDASKWVTGSIMNVDGGFTAK